jgi:hypothetical protein
LLGNRLAVVGFALVGFFAFVAIAAPVLAPPPEDARDPMKIPRDGFGTVPLPPGSPWVLSANSPSWASAQGRRRKPAARASSNQKPSGACRA